jgi:hypothetical protein
MSFAADLKDFATNFRETYKTLHVSGKDELASEQAASLREERDAKARGEAVYNRGAAIKGLNTPDARAAEATSDPTKRRAPSMALPGAIGEYASAIQRVESSGNPEARGPVIKRGAYAGDRAYGLYQIMGKNIPSWTKAALGRAYSPEEFVKDEDAQNKTFQHRFGGYVRKYGNPEDAASMWFTGLRYKDALRQGRGDQLGTRVQDYVRKFKAGLGRTAALDIESDDETVPVVYAARGGVIPSGWDRMNDTTESESAGSNPVTRDVMDERRGGLTDDDYDPRQLVDIDGARAAIAGGLKFGQRTLGLETHHAAVPEASRVNPDGVTALQTNAGAPTQEEVKVIHKTVDPKGELPPELREIAGFNALQKFWTARGEPQKAERAAWQMLQAGKKAVSQYGALALSIDDPVARAQIIAKAHNQFLPDGEVMKITGKSGDGAKFELFDNTGKLTEKGVLAMDDMVKMATGMHNGTQYLQAMVQFATAAPGQKEKDLERRRGALADFDAGSPEDDIVTSRLSEKQKEALGRMDPQDRRAVLTQERQKLDIERKQANFETRLKVGAENMDRKEAMSLFKDALRLGMWDTTRDQVMTMHEQKLAQLEKQEAGRNTRFDQSQEARRKRNAEIDQRILEKRTATRDGAGVKLTPKEAAEGRRMSAVDIAEQDRLEAIDQNAAIGDDGMPDRGPTGERARAAAQVEAGYQRVPEKGREVAYEGMEEIDNYLKEKLKPQIEAKALPETDRVAIRHIATNIAASGGSMIPNTEAADYVLSAIDPKMPEPRVLPGGRIQFHPNLPPVRMTGENFIMLAQLRERRKEFERRKGNKGRQQQTGDLLPAPAPRQALEIPLSHSTVDDPRSVNRRRAIDTWGAR